ncbi:MAG: nucleoside triphosphate pyrophosphohydrolase family protein [Bacteroidaceae bacterium]|nr:nucleoside triphosphate pyrophosphohydrolase family protein [Bacteroidaceae bacterium]MCF0243451.1 nucleoside triphosphate pyrophosphohydrolase family protein [Bacteroidaceae bacterium]
MTLNEYQKQAMTTCLPESQNDAYMLLNLVGEVGETCSKIAKAIRKDKAFFSSNILIPDFTDTKEEEDFLNEIYQELGDILWQLSGVCSVMDIDLETIAQMNLNKLASRKQRGVIDGSGDNR